MFGYWASVSEPHFGVFNVDFRLCSTFTYIVCCSWHSWLSWSLVSCTITVTTCLLSVAFIEQVCPIVRPHSSNANRWRQKGWPLRLGWKSRHI